MPEKVFEPEYLLIDGYNILFAWDDLNKVAEKDIDTARQILMDKICNYQSFSRSTCILVFDAYRVPVSYTHLDVYKRQYPWLHFD